MTLHGRKSWQPWFRERVERKVTSAKRMQPDQGVLHKAGPDHQIQSVQGVPYIPTHWNAVLSRQTERVSQFPWEDTWARFDQRKGKDQS